MHMKYFNHIPPLLSPSHPSGSHSWTVQLSFPSPHLYSQRRSFWSVIPCLGESLPISQPLALCGPVS
jgi:hypothetical protein